MKKLWKWLFGTRKQQCNIHDVIHSITCGEPDKDGFADTYVNGEKSSVRMLVWTQEEIDRLHKIEEQIHKENREH